MYFRVLPKCKGQSVNSKAPIILHSTACTLIFFPSISGLMKHNIGNMLQNTSVVIFETTQWDSGATALNTGSVSTSFICSS